MNIWNRQKSVEVNALIWGGYFADFVKTKSTGFVQLHYLIRVIRYRYCMFVIPQYSVGLTSHGVGQ